MKKVKKWANSIVKQIKAHKGLCIILLILCFIFGTQHLQTYLRAMKRAQFEDLPPVERRAVYMERWLKDSDQKVVKKIDSPNNAKMFLLEFNSFLCHYALTIYEDTEGHLQEEWIGLPLSDSCRYDSRIFYDKKDLLLGTYLSSMSKVNTKNGTDVIILITPNFKGNRNTASILYEESTEYAQTPYDTLNNLFEPIYPTTKYDHSVCKVPMWILVLSYESIPEDYELHYGDYVLTYEDIKNGTWEP